MASLFVSFARRDVAMSRSATHLILVTIAEGHNLFQISCNLVLMQYCRFVNVLWLIGYSRDEFKVFWITGCGR